MKIKKINLYPKQKDVTLTTYLWDDSHEMLRGKARPAVIIAPGGGYFSCSDREAEPLALRFASMGYHAFVLNYTTYMDGNLEFPNLSKPLEIKSDKTYPQQIRDVGAAFLEIHKHAQEWLVDTERIAIAGFSAGGHNAALYATSWDKPVITDYFRKPVLKFRPAAVILGYPVVDYSFMAKYAQRSMDKMDASFHAAAFRAFLGEKATDEATLKLVSPNLQVNKNTPPMFIWATAEDSLVPAQNSLRLANALADSNVPFELHVFEKGGHGLSLANQASSEAKSQINADVAKWADLVQAWLEKRFALNLPKLSAFEEMLKKDKI